jgi:hypothetical protein
MPGGALGGLLQHIWLAVTYRYALLGGEAGLKAITPIEFKISL